LLFDIGSFVPSTRSSIRTNNKVITSRNREKEVVKMTMTDAVPIPAPSSIVHTHYRRFTELPQTDFPDKKDLANEKHFLFRAEQGLSLVPFDDATVP
jgi:hypothetical protein